jgi:hypothetical protein
MRVDIDKLEALEKAATPGPWRYEDSQLLVNDPDTLVGLHVFSCCNWDDEAMEAIVGIRNAFPELLSEVMELRGIAEAARDLVGWGCFVCQHVPAGLESALARYDAGGAQ